MPSNYRIRTQLNVDTNIQVKLEQKFDTLEVLSLSIQPEEIYTRTCADFGVVCGRVFVNNGFGLPNAKISIFIPLDAVDEYNEVISSLYPFKTIETINDDGYKYNLLPYTKSHSGHVPVGTFPDRIDALTDKNVIEVYDKYYRYTVQTNSSGDFMMIGLPLGNQELFMQVDLSDIGEFSLTPQDLVRLGIATEDQIDGTNFKFSTNYDELPQIVTIRKIVNVAPFFGQPEVCNYSIGRADFDITSEKGIRITPAAVFMGSLISTTEKNKVGFRSSILNPDGKCKVKFKAGNMCDIVTGPGSISAIRQTVFLDDNRRPILEVAPLENGGDIIDGDGTWVTDIPMNMDYVYTDENGDRKISLNPEIGIPTKSKCRFKIKWQQSPQLSLEDRRGYFLVPNIKERGWINPSIDPNKGDFYESITTYNVNENTLVINLNSSQGQVYYFNKRTNVENLKISANTETYYGSYLIQKPGVNTTFFLEFERTDESIDAIFEFQVIKYQRFLLEGSYAFSLDWNDYANPDEAIDCEDTFYEMQYNKVYTVSQFMDRYQTSRLLWNTNQIKYVNDEKCEATHNKFPVNDAYYRLDIFFIIINFVISLFKYQLIIYIAILHVLAFIYGVVIKAIDAFLKVLRKIVRGICNAVNWLRRKAGKSEKECPPKYVPPKRKNPLTNLGIPLLLFTEDGCEFCKCSTQDKISFSPQLLAAAQDRQSSVLVDCTDSDTYTRTSYPNPLTGPTQPETLSSGGYELGGPSDNPNDKEDQFNELIAGSNYTGFRKRTPTASSVDQDNGSETELYSYSLPWGESLNLFNGKDKYFKASAINPDGPSDEFNQIRVKWFPDSNLPDSYNEKIHKDNVMMLLLDPGSEIYPSGSIITFQDPQLSNDPNSKNDETGFGGSYGTRTNFPVLSVKYANPSNPEENLTTTYVTYGLTGVTQIIDGQFAATTSFKSDIEYFQVITAMTVSDFVRKTETTEKPESYFSPIANSSRTTPYRSYARRYLRYMTIGYDAVSQMWEYSRAKNVGCCRDYMRRDAGRAKFPNCVDGIEDMVVVILMRGVDMHSPRVDMKISLSNIFGKKDINNWDDNFTIRGNFRMNIPIQAGLKLCRHHHVLNTTDTDNSCPVNKTIFYNSYTFFYNPGSYSGFTSRMPAYYSAVDSELYDSGDLSWGWMTWNSGLPYNFGNFVGQTETHNGYLRIKRNNNPFQFSPHTGIWCNSEPDNGGATSVLISMTPNDELSVNGFLLGYLGSEYVEGMSVYNSPYFSLSESFDCNGNSVRSMDIFGMFYTSPTYAVFSGDGTYWTENNVVFNWNFNSRFKNVVRTDRMPGSTNEQYAGINSLLLHQNSTFALFLVDDGGGSESQENITQEAITEADILSQFVPYQEVLESTYDCTKAVTLDCYTTEPDGTPIIKPDANLIMDPSGNEKYFRYGQGCYNFVSSAFESLPKDIQYLLEWVTRVKISLSACFEIFAQSFSNQWINGTLYAFSFKSNRFFDSNNQPYSTFCKDLIYFHEATNNFYYRSSPFLSVSPNLNIGKFIGKRNDKGAETNTGNEKLLLFPTTIADLGPKVEWTQELVFNDDYDGYVVSKIPTTTLQDNFELFQMFVVSRLVNVSLLSMIVPTIQKEGNSEPTVSAFFNNKRWKATGNVQIIPGQIDADYAQSLGTNSQFGIREFSADNYVGDYVYVGPSYNNPVFGIFFTGSTQDRDYISPRRNIYKSNGVVSEVSYDMAEITGNKTQIVPFYLWDLDLSGNNIIFGNQNNNFFTNTLSDDGLNDEFFSYRYQKLDRFSPQSRYFRPGTNVTKTNFYLGVQDNYDTNGEPIANIPDSYSGMFVFGAPYYFYFGLNKGYSAMDKFIKKYVNADLIIE
jgi:hypothetical protein